MIAKFQIRSLDFSQVYWKEGRLTQPTPTLEQVRDKVQRSLKTLRNDHKRTLNPTPYKVSNTALLCYNLLNVPFCRFPLAMSYTVSFTIFGCRMHQSVSCHDNFIDSMSHRIKDMETLLLLLRRI